MHSRGPSLPATDRVHVLHLGGDLELPRRRILGGIINPPIASYYEHGTFLTLAHAHSSMFGVFGLLALGLVYFGVRAMTPTEGWSDRLPMWTLRLFNAAIVLWLALNLIPIGIAQVVAVVDHGYWYARSLAFYDKWIILQWLRLAGDGAFMAAGLVMLWDVAQKLRAGRRPEEPAALRAGGPPSVRSAFGLDCGVLDRSRGPALEA